MMERLAFIDGIFDRYSGRCRCRGVTLKGPDLFKCLSSILSRRVHWAEQIRPLDHHHLHKNARKNTFTELSRRLFYSVT